MKIAQKTTLLALVCFVAMTGCKKQVGETVSINSLADNNMMISLNSEEQIRLADVFKKDGVKDSADFLSKIKFIKSQVNYQNSLQGLANQKGSDATIYDIGEGESVEEQNIANFYTWSAQEMNEYDPEYSAVAFLAPLYPYNKLKAFKGVGNTTATFSSRGNRIMFTIPYIAIIKVGSPNEIVKLSPMTSSPPSMSPLGGLWGTYSSSGPAYMQPFGDNSADVHAEGSEIRTEIRSTDGKVKISTGADVGVYKAGAELEAGFTISSARNIYNQYVLSGSFTINLMSFGSGDMPQFNFSSSLKCSQYGILYN